MRNGASLGGLRAPLLLKSADYTVTLDDFGLLASTSANDVTFTLPRATECPGQIFCFKKGNSENAMIITSVSGNIDGVASMRFTGLHDTVILQSNGGSSYWILTRPSSSATSLTTAPQWLQFTVTHDQLQAAALTNNIEVYSLPGGGIIHATMIKHGTPFSGPGITDYKVSLGLAADLTKYGSLFDVDTAVAATTFQLTQVMDSVNNDAVTSIKIAAVSVGANLNASTAGGLNVGLLVSRCDFL